MKIEGNYTIHASRDRVFALLVSEDVLRRCVPGCRRLVREGDDRFAATSVTMPRFPYLRPGRSTPVLRICRAVKHSRAISSEFRFRFVCSLDRLL